MSVEIYATLGEPHEIAATLSDLRYLVFQGLKGDTGDSAYEEAVAHGFVGTEAEWLASLKGEKGDPGEDGVSFVLAYLDEGVVRYANAYGEHDADDIYTATAMAQDIDNGILPLVHYSPEDDVFDYFELDRYDIGGATWVVYFRSKDYLLSVDSTGAYTLTDRPQGGSGSGEFVLLRADDDGRVFNGATAITGAQIFALVEAGKAVFLWDDDGEYLYASPIAHIGDVYFFAPAFDGNGFYIAVVDENDNECSFSTRPAIPRALAADAGKVLTVDSNGEWTKQTPSGSADAVLYTAQSLTDAQKTQARTNVGAGTYSKPSGGIPKSDLASAVQTSLGKADTALQTAPVTSVNNKTGAVTLTASDVGALPSSTSIPTKVSDLTNDSNFQTAAQVSAAISTAAASKADKTLRVAMTSADTTPTLNPNTFYVFPEMASLTPTLNTPSDATIVNEYHFIFTSGATATTLTLPAAVLQPDGFTVEANHVYEVSIVENCMTAQGWAVSA